MRIKFFWYKHPKTGEMLSDQRMTGYEKKPLVVKGVKCELVKDYVPPVKKRKALSLCIINKNREVFQADSDWVKECNPKYVKYNDGHRERYNPAYHN